MACIPFQAERARVRLFHFVATDSLSRNTRFTESSAERLKCDLAPLTYQRAFIGLQPLSGARYAPLKLNWEDGPGDLGQDSGRDDGTCNLCYRICIIIYGKSYIANGGGDLLPKIATWTRNSPPGHVRCSGQHRNPNFPG